MHKWSALWLAVFAGVASLATSHVAFAEKVDEVLVTARRVEESLQKVPISITALSSSALDERRIEDITALSNFVPNLTLLSSTSFGGSSTSFAFIRGVGQPEVFLQNDPGVGIYVDGVYFGRSQGSIFEVLDLERVEVLRGPQGTLYGRNTIGGAINLISAKLTEATSFSAQMELGNYEQHYGRFSANIPLSETVLSSFAVSVRQHDGFVEADPHPACASCSTDDLSDEDTIAGRASLRFLPTDNLTVDLVGDYTHKHNLPIGRRLVVSLDGFPPYDAAVTAIWGVPPSAFANSNHNTHSSNITGFDRQEIWGTSLTAEWKFDAATLKSITGYRELDVHHSSDSDGSPQVINTIVSEQNDQDQLSQEFQLTSSAFDQRLDWLVGVFGMSEDASSVIQQAQGFAEVEFPSPFNSFTFVIPNPCFDASLPPYFGCPPRGEDSTDLDVRSYAIFAHSTLHVTDQISLSAGLRYTYEEKDFYFTSVANASLFDLDDHWDSLTPRIGVEYQATDRVLLYASYSEGFKSGTFNNGNDPSQPLDVEPEEATSYEIGAKTSWWNGRAIANIALFTSDYKNQQLQVRTNVFTQTFAFVNVASSEISGGELEFTILPTERLRIDGGVGYTDSEITDVAVTTPNVTEGAKLVRTPELTVNFGAALAVPVLNIYQLELRADYAYRSDQEGDFTNNANDRVDPYSLVNLRAELSNTADEWAVYVFLSNAFDNDYELARAGFDPAVSAGVVDGAPRTYGLGLTIDF